MASDHRQQTPSLAEQLFTQGYDFEFHQAIKILETLYPQAVPLGRGAIPEQEAVVLKSRILFSYPPSDIYEAIQGEAHEHSDNRARISRVTLKVNFLGIAGVNGPLPLPYSEKIFERLKSADHAAADFLDIFNHRLLSILHRIRRKHWAGLDSARPDKTRLAQVLYSFAGLATEHLQDRMSFPDRGLLFYAGLFWQQPKSQEGLRIILSHYFGLPVTIVPFRGGWEQIESAQVSRIGDKGQFNRLGQGVMLGERVWNAVQKLIVRIGPLTNSQFRSFLPGEGHTYQKLCEIIRLYLGIQQKFEINLIMKAHDVEAAGLRGQTLLGWTSWLKSHRFQEDDGQVSFQGKTDFFPKQI